MEAIGVGIVGLVLGVALVVVELVHRIEIMRREILVGIEQFPGRLSLLTR